MTTEDLIFWLLRDEDPSIRENNFFSALSVPQWVIKDWKEKIRDAMPQIEYEDLDMRKRYMFGGKYSNTMKSFRTFQRNGQTHYQYPGKLQSLPLDPKFPHF